MLSGPLASLQSLCELNWTMSDTVKRVLRRIKIRGEVRRQECHCWTTDWLTNTAVVIGVRVGQSEAVRASPTIVGNVTRRHAEQSNNEPYEPLWGTFSNPYGYPKCIRLIRLPYDVLKSVI